MSNFISVISYTLKKIKMPVGNFRGIGHPYDTHKGVRSANIYHTDLYITPNKNYQGVFGVSDTPKTPMQSVYFAILGSLWGVRT